LAADHTDEGTVGAADGVSYYQSGAGSNGLLILPDVWGWNGGRVRAIADDFAKKGLNVWIPKILPAFEGGTDDDGLPPAFNIGERGAELGPLLKGSWNSDVVMPNVMKIVDAMRASGVKKFGAIGFCYGGWIGMKLSSKVGSDEMVCGASPHPSMHIESGVLGRDVVELAKANQCPWALYPTGEVGKPGADGEMYDADHDFYKALETRFPGKNRTKRFSSQVHGFVVRGSIKDGNFKAGDGDSVKVAVQECLADITAYFALHRLCAEN